jgi:hypothetical protein
MRRLSWVAILAAAGAGSADVYDLTDNWSDSDNPNGAWAYREASNALPHVDAWERGWDFWDDAQPGWAESETGNNRIPFWFRAVGVENFDHDWQVGDVIVHSTDDASGVGNGPANVAWTSPAAGSANLSGAVWMGRDIGRANNWTVYHNQTVLTSGHIESGDAYSRNNPFDLADGSGGEDVLKELALARGDELRLEFVRTTQYGDFIGVRLTIDFEPGGLRGDMNCDGSVDFDDIDAFVTALISREEYESQYPACDWLNGDINQDGSVDFNDIDGFVECIIDSGCP